MRQARTGHILLGIFYLTAFLFSVLAVLWFDPLLQDDWASSVNSNSTMMIKAGLASEVLLIVSVIGTGVMLYPHVRRVNENVALGYFGFRFLEAVTITIGLIGLLVLFGLGEQVNSGERDSADLETIGSALQSIHRWTMVIGPNLWLGINTFLYSSLLLKGKLVHPRLAWFGIITAVMVFVAGVLDMSGVIEPWSPIKGLISLPVGVFEVSLAIWAITKGLATDKVESL